MTRKVFAGLVVCALRLSPYLERIKNIQLANSLKLKGYDFHFSFGGGSHHAALAVSELPQCLTWLWRDYDPARTEQVFEQSADEQSKPPFRVRIYNR